MLLYLPGDGVDVGQFREQLRRARECVAGRDWVLGGCMRRVVILSDRLQTRRPRAQYWPTLRVRVDYVRSTVAMLNTSIHDITEWQKRGDAASQARDDLAASIEQLRLSMRLPRPIRDPLWRLGRRPFVAVGKPAIWVYWRFAEALAATESRHAERRRVPAQRGPTTPATSGAEVLTTEAPNLD